MFGKSYIIHWISAEMENTESVKICQVFAFVRAENYELYHKYNFWTLCVPDPAEDLHFSHVCNQQRLVSTLHPPFCVCFLFIVPERRTNWWLAYWQKYNLTISWQIHLFDYAKPIWLWFVTFDLSLWLVILDLSNSNIHHWLATFDLSLLPRHSWPVTLNSWLLTYYI